MAFISVAAGQQIRATHVQQFTNWLTAGKVDTPGTIAATSTTEYTLTVRAQDGGTGLALNVLYGAAASPSTIATFNKAQILLAAPVQVTGTTAISLPQIAAPSSGPGVSLVAFYAKTDGTFAAKFGTSATESVFAAAVSGTSYLLNPFTATGDTLYAGTGNTAARLAKGTAFQELVMNGGASAPAWASGVLALAASAGDLFYAVGANTLARLAPGTARQALIMNNGATGPVWSASLQSVLVSTGMTVYASLPNTPAGLTAGTAFQSYVMNSGATAPLWVAGPHSLVQTAGDLVSASTANTLQRVTAGTATQVLVGGTAPAFTSVSTAMLATNAASLPLSAVGTTTDPTTITSAFATMAEMTITFTAAAIGDLLVWFNGDFSHSAGGGSCLTRLSLDGSTAGLRRSDANNAGVPFNSSTLHRFSGVSASSHTLIVEWATGSGTLSAAGARRTLLAEMVYR